RWPRDWSSDVCSSDLTGRRFVQSKQPLIVVALIVVGSRQSRGWVHHVWRGSEQAGAWRAWLAESRRVRSRPFESTTAGNADCFRSEERRVGKEGRCGG